MELLQAIYERHSVRAYEDRPLAAESVQALEQYIGQLNAESGLHIQLVKNEPKAFDCTLAHYGKFSGVSNYFALVGQDNAALDELCGYYGEKLVLYAQTLGLNTCWVALTYKKIPDAFRVETGEKLGIVISVGYGKTQGKVRPSKSAEAVSDLAADSPDWYRRGVEAALLAPTAVNQQKFRFALRGEQVAAKALPFAPCGKIDLGIVKCHFELGSGKDHTIWMK